MLRRGAATFGALVWLGTGCVNMSAMQTARVLKPDAGEVLIGGGYYTSPELNSDRDEDVRLPYIEIGYRRGVAENFDAGLRYTLPFQLEVDGKYQLLGATDGTIAVAAGAALAYLAYDGVLVDVKSTIVDLSLPLYLSFHPSEHFALYVSPRYVLRYQKIESGDSSDSDNSNLAGLGAGVQFGAGAGFRVEGVYIANLDGSEFDVLQIAGGVFF